MNESKDAPTEASAGSLFRNSYFKRLWPASILSSAGSSIGLISILWLVYSSTGSAVDVAILGIIGVVPRVGFGLLAGGLADRMSKTHLMLFGDFLRASFLILLSASLILTGFHFTIVVMAAFFLGVGQSIFRTSISSFIPSVVEPELLGKANGLFATSQEIFGIIGSPLGGILIAFIGVPLTLSINAATYLISGIFTLSVIVTQRRKRTDAEPISQEREPLLREIYEGIAYVRSERALLKLTLSSLAGNFFLSLFFTFIIVYVKTILLQGPFVLGVLSGLVSAGFVIGSLIVGWTKLERKFGIWYAIGWGIGGLAISGVLFSHNIVTVGLSILVVGLGGGFGNTVFFTGVQRFVPPKLLGRYLSIDEVGSLAANPAGQASGGFVISFFGINTDFLIASLGTAISMFILLIFPDIRSLKLADNANEAHNQNDQVLEEEELENWVP